MTANAPTDRELVAALLAGSEPAFRAFFDAYFPRVFRFALPRLDGNADDCKEVVQTTLIKAIRGLSGYRGEAALFTWLCQICRRQIVDHLRTHHRRRDNIVAIDDSPELRAALEAIEAPEGQGPAQLYDAQATRKIVQSVLDRLPSRYGDILEWKYIQGDSVEEIGARLGVSHAAAQSMLARARTAFREAVETVFGRTAGEILADLPGS